MGAAPWGPKALPQRAMRWRQAQPQGRVRKPCEGHTASHVDKCLYLLFGKHEDDNGSAHCPPMHLLDTERMELKLVQVDSSTGHHPDDREGHSASVVGRRIYVFGGTVRALDLKPRPLSCRGDVPVDPRPRSRPLVREPL